MSSTHEFKQEYTSMAANAIVYESRNRETGTLCQTIDTRHADAAKLGLPKRPKGNETDRYAARCVEHKSVVFFAEHYPAGRAIAHTSEWCAGCKAMIDKGAEKFKDGSKGAAPRTRPVPTATRPASSSRAAASQPSTRAASSTKTTAPAKSNGKVTSDKKENTQRNRKAAEQRKPSEVTTRSPENAGNIADAVKAAQAAKASTEPTEATAPAQTPEPVNA